MMRILIKSNVFIQTGGLCQSTRRGYDAQLFSNVKSRYEKRILNMRMLHPMNREDRRRRLMQ